MDQEDGMTGEIITVFGGSGFVGRNVVRRLAKAGYRVRVAVRRPNEAHFLRPMGFPGQIGLFQANVRDLASVEAAIRGSDGVINLVGILFQAGRQKFRALQTEGAERVARVAKEQGVDRFIQMSAIGADPKGPSRYAKTKGEGEALVRQHFPEATVLRPSIVFGPEDDFFNRFAGMAVSAPALPLVRGGKTKFQPVHVDDVAEACLRVLADPSTQSRTYELGGPRVATFRECLELMLQVIERERILLPIPTLVAYPMALAAQIPTALGALLGLNIPPVLTTDQLRQLGVDNVVGASGEPDIGTLADLGISPATMEAVLPAYLFRYRKHGQFDSGYGR